MLAGMPPKEGVSDLSGFLEPISSRNAGPGYWFRFPLRHELQRCFVFQTGMGSNSIVVLTPCFDNYLCMSSAVKPIHGQTFIPELPVKALVGSVLPWLTGFD